MAKHIEKTEENKKNIKKGTSFEEVLSPMSVQKDSKDAGPDNSVGFPEYSMPDPLGFLPGKK